MSEVAALVALPKSLEASVVGYVEALTESEAVGWVWCPGHVDRLNIELRLGTETLTRGVADRRRDDLASSGIGDGCHAFSLPLPADLGARRAELHVYAVSPEGKPVRLEPPPPPPPAAATLAPLQRGIETLISSQRLLHRNLQAALLQQGPSPTAVLADIAAMQAKLNDAATTLELFVVRLETALQRSEPAAPPAPRKVLAAIVGMSSLAFVGSCWAVFRSLVGG